MTRLNGCHNKPPREKEYPAQDGWDYLALPGGKLTREPRIVMIQDRMSPGCGYSRSTPDPACRGCRWEHGEAGAAAGTMPPSGAATLPGSVPSPDPLAAPRASPSGILYPPL